MFIFGISSFVVSTLIFIYSLYSIYCFIMRRSLEEYKILNVRPVNKKRIIVLSIARIFMVVSMFYVPRSLNLGIEESVIFGATIVFGHMLSFLCSQILSETRNLLIKFAVKNSDMPKSLIEFKVDMNLLLVDYQIPDYLKYYTSYSTNKTKFLDAMKDEVLFKQSNYSKEYFPLFNDLDRLNKIIVDKDLDCDSSLINMYFIKNINLLTTLIAILKDKKLVNSLCSDEGVPELVELSLDFLNFNTKLESLVVFETKEIKESKKTTESNNNKDNLESVRAMRNFI